MPHYGPDEKCPHGVQMGEECKACQEIAKLLIPRKDGPFEINTDPATSEEGTGC